MEKITIVRYIMLTMILIPIIFIDIKRHIIPNIINFTGAIIGLAMIFFDLLNFRTYLWGAAFGVGFFAIIIVVSEWILKKQGMGEGDAKLMGVIGLFLGLPYTILTTFLSFLLGALYSGIILILRKKKMGEEIPFGPFIAFAAMISMVWGEKIIMWYLGV